MLTARQQEVLDFLRDQMRTTGVMPSTREIQAHFGFASQTAAMNHLRALELKGALRRLPHKARAVMLPEARRHADIVEVPIYGRIAAGLPEITEQETEGAVMVDRQFMKSQGGGRGTFALRVRGDSMIGSHIIDGDLVILEFREPRHGDVVAALIDGETTLKRYLIRHGRPFLKAENPDYPDLIPALELAVQGVMVALIRER
jgi:repressor LexA